MMGFTPSLEKEERPELSPFLPCEDTVRKSLSASQRENPRQESNWPGP